MMFDCRGDTATEATGRILSSPVWAVAGCRQEIQGRRRCYHRPVDMCSC